jgi:hypothetical protein
MVGMTALAQQELLEAPPARRIIVPAGCTSWWGVDGSTLAVAIATVSCEADTVVRYVRTAPFPARLRAGAAAGHLRGHAASRRADGAR